MIHHVMLQKLPNAPCRFPCEISSRLSCVQTSIVSDDRQMLHALFHERVHQDFGRSCRQKSADHDGHTVSHIRDCLL